MTVTGSGMAVVFDLGGVLIDWDPRHLYRKLFAGGEARMEAFLADICSPAWNLGLDAGRPFADGVAELVARHPHERELIEAYHRRWIEMVAGPLHDTVAILDELAERGVPLYALSNWSAETFPLVRLDPAYAFLDRFERIVVSGELGLVKPDPAIYRHLLETIDRPAERCLFIDDNPENVAAATRLGLRAHRFTGPAPLRRELATFGLLEPVGA